MNNVMRHQHRELSAEEKAQLLKIKDDALALYQYIDGLGQSREISLAKTKLEECVMWAVKHITNG